MKYKAALFDLGSTLIEFENQDWSTLGRMGIKAAYPLMKDRFPRLPEVNHFGPTFYRYLMDILDQRTDHSEVGLHDACARIFQRMGLTIDNGIVEKFVNIYYKPVTDQLTLIPGAVEILEKLKDAGLIIGLVSNSIFPEEFHLGEMERFGLLKYFDFTIFSSSIGKRKPGKAIFEMALDKANVDSSQAIFIGDRFDADIVGAKNLGIISVWKHRENRENPDNVIPDYSIINLSELETIVLDKE
ncbi:MAG: HAD family hydrolase [candidate division Zixibacteria bacterium]|nr:HAD family hydrolase [candidate division Zixibacteria bacterium]